VSGSIEGRLEEMRNGLFMCSSASRASVEEQLKTSPVHECGLTFNSASENVSEGEATAAKARDALNQALDRKVEVFLNTTIRERLKQGEAEPSISELLKCKTVEEVHTHLVKACLSDATIVETINRYLKRIAVKRVRVADFKPVVRTVEKEQFTALSHEFERFLEDQLTSIEGDDDTLPMLQLE
jgi:hypothetical protein